MSFLSPWFLLGLLGVAIPLAIHLSRRQKAEKVLFSTVRFLKRRPKKMIFFQRIRQWLLLLVRAAIIAMLAIAFARPFIPQTVFGQSGLSPRSVVILIDTSMSMRYGDTFKQAKTAALDILDSLRAGDEAALVTFSDGTENVKELTTSINQVAEFVRQLDSPGFNSTNYLPAIRLADQMLRAARHPDRTVVLVSDFRQRAVAEFDTRWRLSPGVGFEGIKIGGGETTNLAVTAVKSPVHIIPDQQEHIIIARVRYHGSQAPPEARISLSIDDKVIETQQADLTGGPEAVVTFRTQFRKRGIHLGAVTVEDDSFTPDNTFFFTVNVLQPMSVLAVLDAASNSGVTDEIRWLESALGKRGRSPFHLELIRSAEFADEELQPFHVIALLNVGDLASSRMATVAAYLEKGGSLLMAPAARVAAPIFNRLFRGLSPARLDQKRFMEDGDVLSITGINRRHPIIKALGLNESGDFGAARFKGYWSSTPVEGGEVILRFDNGEAALLEKKVGRGRVLLFTSSLDTQWNNLPRQGLYVPLVHEMLRYLARHEEQKPWYTVGEPVRLMLPAGNALRISAPHDAETILTSAAGGDVFFRDTDRAGFYAVRGRQEPDALAVNVSAGESDLTPGDPSLIGAALVNDVTRSPVEQRGKAASIAAHVENSQRLWWWILLAVLFLGLGETLLANRTYR